MIFRIIFSLFALLVGAVHAGTSAEGLQFLAAKAKEQGVVQLPSGLLYKEIKAGTGKTPSIDTPTKCHYSGRLIDGTEFDSSYKRGEPATFKPNQVIKGWTEAMQLMKEGSKWELYIPSELAYGDRGAGGLIPPGAALIFEMEMLQVVDSSSVKAEGLKFLAEKEKEAGVVKLPSGLLYKEIKAGSGKSPGMNTPAKCHYSGRLIDGTEFDSSYKRGEPATFKPNQVIRGWTEAMQLMKEGSKWELYIPSDLAYGERGAGGLIPAGATLIFEMEILEVLG